jgi:hypothetical protein
MTRSGRIENARIELPHAIDAAVSLPSDEALTVAASPEYPALLGALAAAALLAVGYWRSGTAWLAWRAFHSWPAGSRGTIRR